MELYHKNNNNNAVTMFRQQLGFGTWKNKETLIRRLRCTDKNSFTLLSSDTQLYSDPPIFACRFSHMKGQEHMVALANENGHLTILNCKDKQRVSQPVHNNAIFDLDWLHQDAKIVTASGDHTAKLVDFGKGEITEVKTFHNHTRSVKTVACRKSDWPVFATGGRDGNIILWDIRTQTNTFVRDADQIIAKSHMDNLTPKHRRGNKVFHRVACERIKSVTGLVFQDYNTLISCGAGDGMIKVWDLRKSYNIMRKATCPKYTLPYAGNTSKNGFSSIVMDKNCMKLYANCLDNVIYCYNIATYDENPIMKYVGHQNNTFYIKSSISNDGDYLISGSSDEHAYIWNTKHSQPLVRLTGHTAEVTCVSWSNLEEPTIVTCSDDMTHKLWMVGEEEEPPNFNIIGKGKAETIQPKENTDLDTIKSSGSADTKKRCREMDDNQEEEEVVWNCPKRFVPMCKGCEQKVDCTTKCEICSEWRSILDFRSLNGGEKMYFSPRRLFRDLNSEQNEASNERLARKLEDPPSTSSNHVEIRPEIDKNMFNSPSTSKLRNDTILQSSPTVNLPNFVVDGTAPHINYSPPKKRNEDWLTRMRTERNIKKRMTDENCNNNEQSQSPKVGKLELTPSRKRNQALPKNSLLKYFKVTNSTSNSSKCEDHHNCSQGGNNFFNSNSPKSNV